MARMRIEAKVRRNHCYIEMTRILDQHGLRYELHPPAGKGHPFLAIKHPEPGRDPIIQHVACSPKGFKTGRRALGTLRRKLREAGIDA